MISKTVVCENDMSDPVTIGSLVVSLIVKVAESGFGEIAKGAAKDTYEKLKQKISQWTGPKIDILEAAPDSEKTRREIIAVIDGQDESDLQNVKILAQKLIEEIKNSSTAIGLDFSDLRNVEVSLEDVSAKGGAVGGRITNMEGGSIKAKNVRAEGDPSK
jgi:hypothetical protein